MKGLDEGVVQAKGDCREPPTPLPPPSKALSEVTNVLSFGVLQAESPKRDGRIAAFTSVYVEIPFCWYNLPDTCRN